MTDVMVSCSKEFKRSRVIHLQDCIVLKMEFPLGTMVVQHSIELKKINTTYCITAVDQEKNYIHVHEQHKDISCSFVFVCLFTEVLYTSAQHRGNGNNKEREKTNIKMPCKAIISWFMNLTRVVVIDMCTVCSGFAYPDETEGSTQ